MGVVPQSTTPPPARTDLEGRVLKVGDSILFATSAGSGSAELRKGVVMKFTPKRVAVRALEHDAWWNRKHYTDPGFEPRRDNSLLTPARNGNLQHVYIMDDPWPEIAYFEARGWL